MVGCSIFDGLSHDTASRSARDFVLKAPYSASPLLCASKTIVQRNSPGVVSNKTEAVVNDFNNDNYLCLSDKDPNRIL